MKHPSENVEVTAPNRLHFGLLNLGHGPGRHFGGVGLMIDQPGLRLRISAADRFSAAGPLSERATEFAKLWARFHRRSQPPACKITVVSAPRQHAGLGVGTQLGMSIAAGLCCFDGWCVPSPDELAMSVGRGRRSAIGTHGFLFGGLLAERGCLESERVAPLDCQLELPAAWQVVLVCPMGEGLSGRDEDMAFEKLPPVSRQRTKKLERIIREKMFPAAAQGDFDQFSRSIYEYGYDAGECFASRQGGPYNGPRLTQIVNVVRSLGIDGVGQSSWGPTVFALVRNAEQGRQLACQLRQQISLSADEVWTSPVNHGGARWNVSKKSLTLA